jgi:hypothetical protein
MVTVLLIHLSTYLCYIVVYVTKTQGTGGRKVLNFGDSLHTRNWHIFRSVKGTSHCMNREWTALKD